MKISELTDLIQANELKLPQEGTGKNGRILAKDLEYTLGTYFARLKYGKDEVAQKHLEMRRWFVPQKAYRFKDMDVEEKKHVLVDNNEWILEQKFDGWRMILTYVPGDGFMVWGGNISDIDFLPVDYTDRVVFKDEVNKSIFKHPFIIDSEAICEGSVEMLDGTYSVTTLDAVKAILGSDSKRALMLQEKHTINFHCFDVSSFNLAYPSTQLNRSTDIRQTLANLRMTQLHRVPQFSVDKKQKLQEFWRLGFEGCILKNQHALIVPGSRSKDINIKIKRSMSGEIGEDIDAFISGYILTKEWTKRDLIGGIELSVYVDGEPHHIATVSSMSDETRFMLTKREYDGCMKVTGISLSLCYYDKVLVIDGQELSSRNKMIMHAVVDWNRGFRQTKEASDCTFNMNSVKKELF